MRQILEKISDGKGQAGDIEMLEHLASVMKDGALCALGQTAPNPVLSTIRYFRDEYEAHINKKKCPAKVCKALITYSIVEANCPGCGLCVKNCPQGAIESMGKKQPVVMHQEMCIKCGICYDVCKLNAVEVG
jgi:NADH-quinone oxidoreductase subunit F